MCGALPARHHAIAGVAGFNWLIRRAALEDIADQDGREGGGGGCGGGEAKAKAQQEEK